MKITADTSVLVRALMEDDLRQSKIAQSVLSEAETVVLAIPVVLINANGDSARLLA